MQVILSDHNCEGQAQVLFDLLKHDGDWLTLVPMELRWFRDVGIPLKADDETVWRYDPLWPFRRRQTDAM